MEIFNKSEEQSKMFKDFSEKIESISMKLLENGNEKDSEEIRKIKNNFELKIRDFFRDDTKLNIGVIDKLKPVNHHF